MPRGLPFQALKSTVPYWLIPNLIDCFTLHTEASGWAVSKILSQEDMERSMWLCTIVVNSPRCKRIGLQWRPVGTT